MICGGIVEIDLEFDEFLEIHDKKYEDRQEYQRRKLIYQENLDYIRSRNSITSYEMGITHFADLEYEEMQDYLKYSIVDTKVSVLNNDIPVFWDWSILGAVTEVKNQRSCNASYIFAAVGAVESQYYIRNQVLYEFSEQLILDCSVNATCMGQDISVAFDYMADWGTFIEAFYPYEGNQYKCEDIFISPFYKINGFAQVLPNNNQALLQAIYNNPVAVMMNIASKDFFFYKSGIFDGDCYSEPLNHAMLAVGYNQTQYIKFKNSWGVNWGMNGYIYIANDGSDGSGVCGIQKYGLFPT